MTEPKNINRCAIYTRKSSEEGLEQSFNSLDAQREACTAFIFSQKQEGWRVLPTAYDDGGYSGGTLDRPALTHLLADVEAQSLDTIVVYKVDRLTRSLSDFAKIVEILYAHGVSFVSVTQQFNTTTSMGRLTLNILLSFSQFEREVTGERIRDKIAASKKKGMWMGGSVPLGYEVRERKLVVNADDAEFVRDLYRLYLQHGSVRRLKAYLDGQGIQSKIRISSRGRQSGGGRYYRGALYQILKNRVYLGEIPHRDQSYPGQHEAIVPKELWEQVQAKLLSDNQGRRTGLAAHCPSLLAGLLQDSRGNPFTPSHTVRRGKRYRYYVCRSAADNANRITNGPLRLPAHEIEAAVSSRVRLFLESANDVMDRLALPEKALAESQKLVQSAAGLARRWRIVPPRELYALLRQIVQSVSIHTDMLEVVLSRPVVKAVLLHEPIQSSGKSSQSDDLLHLELAAKLVRVRGEVTLVLPPDPNGAHPQRAVPSLLKAVARAHVWREQVIEGNIEGPRSLARQMGVTARYAGRICECGFLAPDIIDSILDGRQPSNLTFQILSSKLPMAWSEQRQLLGFAPKSN